MGRHIPGNPIFVPQDMSGAGGIKAANFLYNVAPKDGSVFGGVHRGVAMEPLFGNIKAKFDPNKFNRLGGINNEVSVCVSWGTVAVKTLDDAFKKELIIGGKKTKRKNIKVGMKCEFTYSGPGSESKKIDRKS